MIEIGIIVISIILQLLAALLALRLISLTRHRTAWMLISVALVLMIARRITTLVRLDISETLPSVDLFEVTGLVVSAFMLEGFVYIHRYLYDTFAAESILRESEQRYRTLVQNIPNAAVFLFERDHRYTMAEGPALQKLGLTGEQFEGKTIWEASLPKEWVELFASIEESVKKGTSTITERSYKGSSFLVQSVPIKNEGGIVVVYDITQQLRAEKERIAAYEFLQHTIDGVAEPVMVIGLDYQIKLMNRVIRETYGSNSAPTPEVCYTLSHRRDVPCNDPSHPCPLQKVSATLMPVTVLHEHQTAHGEIRQVEILASPLFDKNGRLEGIIEASRDITERKQAEEALRESERVFRGFLEQSVDAIMLANEQGVVIQWSKGAEKITGYSRNESIGKPLWDVQFRSALDGFKSTEHYALIKASLQAVLLSGQGTILNRLTEATIQRPDGIRVITQTLTFPIQTHKGFMLGSILRDITERKQAEEAMCASEARYKGLFEDSPFSLWEEDFSLVKQRLDTLREEGITDFEEYFTSHPEAVTECAALIRVLDVNKATVSLFGANRKEDILNGLVERLDGLSPEVFQEELINIAAGKTSFRLEGINKTLDGRLINIDFSWSIAPGYENSLSKVIVSMIEITERKQAEGLIHRHAEELEALVRVSAAMRAAQSQGEILSAVLSQVVDLFNAVGAALGTYDASCENVIIQESSGVWKNWTGRRQPISNRITNKVLLTGKSHVTKELSSEKLIEGPVDTGNIPFVACVPVTTNLRMVGVLWLGCQNVITDKDLSLLNGIADMVANALQRQALHEDLQAKLKALQEAQAQIIQSEKLAAVGQLTSGIAHELNNPLTSVVLYTQMMQRRSLDDSAKRDLDKVVKETLRASKIVRGLLDFARQHSPESRPVNINDILESVADFVTYELRSHNIQSELDLSPALPITMADPYQLQQVFINLVNNAWQAVSETGKEGHLWIKTEVGPSTYKVNPDNNSTVIRIIVKDDGPGIPEEHLSKIFDPFFTTKPEGKGTGLGLSICHGIISEHGGNIWVESKVGLGSKFIIELPVISPGHAEAAIDADLPSIKPLENSHLLIIDDDSNVLEVLTRALRGKGYHVEAASSATDGLEKMAQVDYSTILCDIRMPGISGPGFYKEVRSRNPKLVKRIVLMTGDVMNTEAQILIKEKNILSLTKPFELSELYKVIQLIENDLANEN